MNKLLILCHVFLFLGIMLIFSVSAFPLSFTFSNFAWEEGSKEREQAVSEDFLNSSWSFQIDNRTKILHDSTHDNIQSRDTSSTHSDDTNDSESFGHTPPDNAPFVITYYSFITPLIQDEGIDMEAYYYIEDDEYMNLNIAKNKEMNSVSWDSYYKTKNIDSIYIEDNLRENSDSNIIPDVSSVIANHDFMIFYTSDISMFVDTSQFKLEKTTHKLWRKFIRLLEATGNKLRELF